MSHSASPGTGPRIVPSADELRRRVEQDFPAALADLYRLVAIPSLSTLTADRAPLERSAESVASLLKSVGVQDVEIVHARTESGILGGPGVLGRIPGPAGAPTVLLYAHHDVQPVADDWDTDPFVPTQIADRLYGRGSADDGAGVVAHVAALRALGSELGVGIAVFIEGEEEAGSPTFARILSEHADRLAADIVIVADSDNWAIGVPALTVSLRGVAELTVTLRIAEHAVHSGMFGGPILDAPLLLARLISTLHDDDGAVAVPGLAATGSSQLAYPEDRFREDSSLLPGVRLAGRGSVADRLWWSPAIDLIGFDATSVDAASGTIIPQARAKLSLRVPPGTDAAEAQAILHRYLLDRNAFGAEVTVEDGAVGEPFTVPADSQAMEAATWALCAAWGREPVNQGQGGSIPLTHDLAKTFPGIQVLLTGVEDPDSRAHSGNESVHLGELQKAILAEALLLARLATSWE
ncbi:MAG: M20/M25/M40 family metallo-hydrolase [Bifidobacteriaceae bacterium]|jgi:acetylornithine deacetylase/succinyl-diaminopimelate desuccinylase-like protein|nr:M20/M25/M40 family metallo-hydrolase [Bifidobacteriaceae bacterium]